MSIEERPDRYDLENLPISQLTREGLTAENINYIGAIGRMLYLQDEVIRIFLEKQTEKIEKRFDAIERRLTQIEFNLNEKEKRIIYLEQYASWSHTVIRHAIAIIVGLIIGWGLHSLIS